MFNRIFQDMYEQPKFYANFNKDTLGNIYDTMKQKDNSSSGYFQFIDNQLHQMCDVFDGIDGELFFGWTGAQTVSGVGFHCAVMENIFFQGKEICTWYVCVADISSITISPVYMM